MSRLSFKNSGTEGMLDVILACLLIFMLFSALAKNDNSAESSKAQTPSEVSLPPMDLSKSEKQQQGHSQSEALNISLKLNQNKLIIYLDDKAMNLAQFKEELLQLKTIAQVNLRRDRDIPISFEDDVILACQAAGIHQVSIVMEI